jgi:hypothetical protein
MAEREAAHWALMLVDSTVVELLGFSTADRKECKLVVKSAGLKVKPLDIE